MSAADDLKARLRNQLDQDRAAVDEPEILAMVSSPDPLRRLEGLQAQVLATVTKLGGTLLVMEKRLKEIQQTLDELKPESANAAGEQPIESDTTLPSESGAGNNDTALIPWDEVRVEADKIANGSD